MLTSPTPKARPTPSKPRTYIHVGDTNAQQQKITGKLGKSQEGMRGQNVYVFECQRAGCGHRYRDDGIQFAHRRCPQCDSGAPARSAPTDDEKPQLLF